MSAMSNLVLDMQEMLNAGYNPVTVADVLNVPIEWVEAEVESMNNEEFDYGD